MIYRVTLTNPILGTEVFEGKKKEPIGLKDMTTSLKRGENHGFTIETEVKLQFYCGAGKEFIDTVRETQGIDGEIEILVESSCGCDTGSDSEDYSIDYSIDYGSLANVDCVYDFYFEGLISLKTWSESDSKDGLLTNVDILPAGIVNTVKNRLDTQVDLFTTETLDGSPITPFPLYEPLELTLHSKAISLIGRIVSDDPHIDQLVGTDMSDKIYVGLPIDLIEYDEGGILYESFSPYVFTQSGGSAPPSVVVNQTGGPITVTVSYNIVGLYTEEASVSRTYDLKLIYHTGFISGVITDYGAKAPGAGVIMSQAINEVGQLTLTLPDNDQLYLNFELQNYTIGSFVSSRSILDLTDISIDVNIATTEADTTGKAFPIFEAGARISQVICDSQDAFRSNYFGRIDSQPQAYGIDGCGSKRAIINGFLIRGFPITGTNSRTIRLSMQEYFRGLNPIDNLGMGIEKIGDDYFIVIEPKSYFYDANTIILTLDNVPNIKKYEVEDKYYARVNVGYEKWETQFRSGLDEVNSKRKYDTGIKAVSNELDLISNFVTGAYPIELTRRKQYSGDPTEDTEYDEENFIICLNEGDITLAEKDENFSIVENIYSPETAYNLRLSPARNLLRWNPIINAGLQKNPGREIKFTSGEGNYKMTSAIDGDCSGNWDNAIIGESDNIQWDDVNNTDKDPIWLPEGADFRFPITTTQHALILANPKGVIEISDTDEDHVKYFIIDYTFKADDLSDFKLLKAFV